MNAKLKTAVKEWLELTEWLKPAQEKEKDLRRFLVKQLFPSTKEGANKLTLPGIEGVATVRVSRKVDEERYQAFKGELLKAGFSLDDLLGFKPSLKIKAYKDLDPRRQKSFDRILTIEDDGLPSLTLSVDPKLLV